MAESKIQCERISLLMLLCELNLSQHIPNYLYQKGQQSSSGDTATMIAIQNNDVKCLEELRNLEQQLVDNDGQTALMRAAS